MIAEYWVAVIVLIACVGFVAGDLAARRDVRDRTRERIERLRRLYVGSFREW